jgi:Ca-activated chloride channel family protein
MRARDAMTQGTLIRWSGFALCGLVALQPARPGAQAQQTFRAETQTVAVYATVTDARGNLVTDLKASDFQIADDGHKRPITVFKSDIQPITVVILLDRSPSLFGVATRTQDAAGEFTRHFLPRDRACLGTFSQVVSLDPAFSADRDAILKHLGDDVPWPAGTALWDATDAARAALEREPDRRVLLILSDGQDNCSRIDPNVARMRLRQDDVMVYAVGFRGREGVASSDLSALARVTGGFAFELRSTDDLALTMQRIADELHRQYVLGFTPFTVDDKIHRIDLKLSRSGLSVRARRSYVASHDSTGR